MRVSNVLNEYVIMYLCIYITAELFEPSCKTVLHFTACSSTDLNCNTIDIWF